MAPPAEELYDVDEDPQGRNHLVDNREFAEVLKKLREHTEKLYSKAVN